MTGSKDNDLMDQVNDALDDSLMDIDANSLSQLNRSRQMAIASAQRNSRWFAYKRPIALSLLSGFVFSIVIISNLQAPLINPLHEDDLEMIEAVETLELFEDLEFYTWLESKKDDEAG